MNVQKLNDYLKKAFYLDRRSLALFRILLGCVAVPYVLYIWTDAEVWFGADGVLSLNRAWLVSVGAPVFSLLFWSTNVFWLHLTMASLLVSVFCFCIGYRSNIAAFVAWFLLNCLLARNPFCWHSGDFLMRLCFFWAIFLPIDHRFAFLRRGNSDQQNLGFGVATVGLILQVFIEYFCAGIAKIGPIWLKGYGPHFVLRLTIFSTDLGNLMSQMPHWVGASLSYLTVFTEVFLPFLLFFPFKNGLNRLVFFIFMLGLHVFIALFMYIDIFPYVCIALLCAVLPSEIWEKSKFSLGSVKALILPKAVTWYLVFIIGFFVPFNIYRAYLNYSRAPRSEYYRLKPLEFRLGLAQEWGLFALYWQIDNTWLLIEGQTHGGTLIDVLRDGQKPLYEVPANRQDGFKNIFWGKYAQVLERGMMPVIGRSFASYLCRSWNQAHADNPVVSVRTTVMRQQIPFPNEPQKPPRQSYSNTVNCEI